MSVSFDLDNLIVEVQTATVTLDVQQDIYEPWKDILRVKGTGVAGNRGRAPQAFRPVGGDDIIPAVFKYAGLIFFRNDLGWRFRLPDENITVNIIGNMALQDINKDFFIARAGRTGALIGLASFVTGVEALNQSINILDDTIIDFFVETADVVIEGDLSRTLTIYTDATKTVIKRQVNISADGLTRTRIV